MRVLAIDPGGSTGMAMWEGSEVRTLTVPSMDTIGEVVSVIIEARPDIIVVETFLSTGKLSKYGIWTLELIGVIKTLVHLAHSDTLVWHLEDWKPSIVRRSPSQRIVFEPKAKALLKARPAIDGHRLIFTDHEVSALAHLWGYLHSKGIEIAGSTVNTS